MKLLGGLRASTHPFALRIFWTVILRGEVPVYFKPSFLCGRLTALYKIGTHGLTLAVFPLAP